MVVWRHMKISRIAPKPLAKVSGLLYAIFGVIPGVFFFLISLVPHGPNGGPGVFAGVAALIFLPIVYGGMGYICGYIGAWIYNFAAKKVGGIEIETE